jgi:hypothetical protein
MMSLDPTRSRIQRARLVLREYATELTKCRAVTVLPDAPVAVLGDHERLAVVDLETGEVEIDLVDDESTLSALVGLTGRRMLAGGLGEISLYGLEKRRATPIRQWKIKSDASDVAATASGSRFVVAAGDRFYVGDVNDPT